MKQLFAFFITLITISLPALGQWQQQRPQLSPDDQRRFDSYYSRWQEYRRTKIAVKSSAWKSVCRIYTLTTEFLPTRLTGG
jgi:hypothetical protein